MKKKIKLTKQGKLLFLGIFIFILALIFGIKAYKTYKYHQTYEYKFLQINYSIDEFNIIKKLDNKYLDELLLKEYDKNIPKFISEKYFLYKNLDRYLTYLKDHNDISLSDIISLVNVNRDKDYYTDSDSLCSYWM